MTEKRFFTKINKNGTLVIIDKECHIEIIDITLACEVLNRLDLKLKTYNEQLGEQQSIIRRDEMSIKTMMSNMKKLEEENEQLRENLHNCRLNKNIISEKLKIWQEVHKEYNIYSIKDFEELLNKLKEENEQLKQQYGNLGTAIVKTCNDLAKEDIYLADFDICKRITEYEWEFNNE